MITSTGHPTVAEQDRIDRMQRLGCPACAVLGIVNVNELELHHLLSGNVRMGHWYSLFLCVQHHRGIGWERLAEVIPPEKHIAISDGRPLFYAVYGSERELWERVQLRLKLSVVWPVSKILPRSVA